MNGSSTQGLNFDDSNDVAFKGSNSVSCSKRTAILLLIFVLVLIAGVALIVYFVAPTRGGCKTLDEEAQWKVCQKLSAKRGECFCNATTPSVVPSTPSPPKPKPTGLRLNKTILPYHYKLELQPYIYSDKDIFGFDGSVQIYVTCNKTTDVIVTHMDQLTIKKNSVELMSISNTLRTKVALKRWEEDVERQFLKLYVDRNLIIGNHYIIKMKFNGTLRHNDWKGFYLSFYKRPSGETRYLATTQFQTTFARRAFPCFDEPSFKATFDVTLVRKAHYSTISNMPVIAQEPRGGDWVADVHDTTLKMSSYLLAFVVSDFKNKTYTTARGTVFRNWANPQYIDYVNYTLSISGAILEAFEDWTNMSYPLRKTDQIAVPHYASGGMENWGLITYMQGALLYNPDYSTTSNLNSVVTVIAHELAHQWFGNLVTCDWWAETWLNEGFAQYFSQIGAAAAEPTWKMGQNYIFDMQRIMTQDGRGNSQPIYLPWLEHHGDLMKAFSQITYQKGSSVIRMMKFFLGEKTFKEGIREYLRAHAYGNVKSEDLYTVLERVAVRKGTVTWDPKKSNLSSIMQTWVDQMNYPLLEVEDNKNSTITVRQRHFLYNRNFKLSYPSPIGRFIWDIPLTYANQAEVNTRSPKLLWMHREENKLITGVKGGWQLVNLWQQGFYRVKYDADTWTAIINQLISDHTVFPVENRAQLMDDAFNLAGASLITDTDAIRATEYLRDETEYLPMRRGLWSSRMKFYDFMFYGTSSYDAYEEVVSHAIYLPKHAPSLLNCVETLQVTGTLNLTYILDLVRKPYHSLHWNDSDFSEMWEKQYRQNIFYEACNRRYRPCVDKAVNLYQQFVKNSAVNPISPNWRYTVYCNGIRNGGAKEWEFAKQMYEKEYTEWLGPEKTVWLQAMACTREPWLIRRYIDYAVEKNSTNMLQKMVYRPAARDAVNKRNLVETLMNYLSTPRDLQMVKAFIRDHPDSSLTNVYKTSIRNIQFGIDWFSKNQKPLESWLRTTNAKYA